MSYAYNQPQYPQPGPPTGSFQPGYAPPYGQPVAVPGNTYNPNPGGFMPPTQAQGYDQHYGPPPPINSHTHPYHGVHGAVSWNQQNPNNQYQPQQQYQYTPPPGPPPGQQFTPQYTPQSNPQQYQPYPSQNYAYQPPPQQQQGPFWYLGAQVPPFPDNQHQQANVIVPGYDPTLDSEKVRKATKGFGTNDDLVISTLAPLSALQLSALGTTFVAKSGKTLVDVLGSETSGWFGTGLHALTTGPLAWDVELVHRAVAGFGTHEELLTELLIARTNDDLRLLKAAYRARFNRDLADQVRSDLSGKTERMFTMALTAARPPDTVPVDHAQVARDVGALYKAGQGKIGTDEITFCDILINRSQPHLTALCAAYQQKYKSLSKVVKSEFSGHMRSALLHIVSGAKPKRDGFGVWRDMKLMEKAMKGMGTDDERLVYRIVRAHWDRPRMEAIKQAYMQRYRKTLESRVSGETSGSYKKLMVALIGNTPKADKHSKAKVGLF